MLVGAVVISLGAAALGQEASRGPAATVRVRPLGPVPASATILKEFVTHDGHNVVWRVARTGGESVILNGRADAPVAAVKSAPTVSPDGSRVAYKIDVEAGTKRALVVDGKIGPSFDQINNDSILFSRDGQHVAYSSDRNGTTVLLRDGQVLAAGANVKSDAVYNYDLSRLAYKVEAAGDRRAVCLDGKTGPAFAQVDNGSMAFSRDGRHFVCIATGREGGPAQATVVLDGEPGPTYERVAALTFSPDCSHLAYIAAQDGQQRVVLDGKPGPAYASVDPFFLRFTAAGSLGYRARRGARMYLLLDGQVSGDRAGILDWSAGPEGRGVAVITRSGETWSVVFNGARGADYDAIAAPAVVSPDGAHVAYAARKGRHWFAVKDGTPGPGWDLIAQGPQFGPDGGYWGYVARRGGQWFVVVDGHENGPYGWFAWGGLRFSPDGQHYAFAAQLPAPRQATGDARWIVVLDGRTVVECDGVATVPLRFSGDGRHLACMVRQGTQWCVVLDGAPGPLFDRLFDITPDFEPDGSLQYPAVREHTLYRVTHTAAGQH